MESPTQIRPIGKTSCDYNIYGFEADGDDPYAIYSVTVSGVLMAKFLDVLDKAADKTLSAYINESTENYIDAMLVMNLSDGLRWFNWGTSVRSAWLETKNKTIEFWGAEEPTDCALLHQALKGFLGEEYPSPED